MRLLQKKSFFLLGLIWMSQPLAAAVPVLQQLQIPQCLAKKLSSAYGVLAESPGFKIIEVPVGEISKISRLADQLRCGRFVNISQQLMNPSMTLRRQAAIRLLQQSSAQPVCISTGHYTIKHSKQVRAALRAIDADNIWLTVSSMATFTNRAAQLKSGVSTAIWLKEIFEHLAQVYGRDDTDTFYVKTGRPYIQNSVVTVIGKNIPAPAIVIGAHMDTLGDDDRDRMPGADDDASGSATAMEVARVLLASKTQLKRPVYIIWYAAEEQGLVGSQQVVRYFLQQKIPVYAVLQLDMTGFRNNEFDKTIWIFRDYTDKPLSDFMVKLIRIYIKVPVANTQCNYGCSDHASWNKAKIPVAFPGETSFEQHNADIHTSLDTVNSLSLEHMTNFTKLALAFVIELAAA